MFDEHFKKMAVELSSAKELFADFTETIRPLTDEVVEFRELSQRLENEVANLPPRMREVFELSRIEGLSQRDIAYKMKISENTVKSTLGKALKVLRGTLTALMLIFL